jgi:hypothetical protein
MTAQQKPKFAPEYKMVLCATILRCVQREIEQAPKPASQRLLDAKYLAQRHLRQATDEASGQP